MTLPYLPPPEPWMAHALCPQIGGGLWDGPSSDSGKGFKYPGAAHQACRLCDVAFECAEYAITNNEPAGLWGGLTPARRRQIRRERGLE